MTAERGTRQPHRIVVTLGDGEPEAGLLQDVMQLAADAVAEIEGLFIEDAELFQLAALPFAQQISRTTGHAGPIEIAEIERHLRRQAELSRELLAAAANRAGVSWRFRVTRGVLWRVLSTTIEQYDLAVLSSGSRRSPQPTAAQRGPIAVVIDGTESGWNGLELAATLARPTGHPVTVFVTAPQNTGNAFDRDVDQRLAQIPHEMRTVATDDDSTLLAALREARVGAVVLPATWALTQPGLIRRLRRELGLPAYLVR